MERGAFLLGTVRDPAGQPVAGVRIRVTEEGTRIGIPIYLSSYSDGRYRTIALPEGSYRVETIHGPRATSETSVVVLESGRENRLDLTVSTAQ